MVVQILLFDAAVLGVFACVIGLALGELLSIAAFHATPGYLASAFPVGNERIVAWQSVALAVGAGMTAACVGVLWPLRDDPRPRAASPGRPQDANRAGGGAARLPVGLACLAFTTVILIVHPRGRIRRLYHAGCCADLPAAVAVRRGRVDLRARAASTQWGRHRARGHRAANAADARPFAGDRRDRPLSRCSGRSRSRARRSISSAASTPQRARSTPAPTYG